MKLSGESYNLKVGTQAKSVHFDQEEILDRAVTKLTNAMDAMEFSFDLQSYAFRPPNSMTAIAMNL